MPILKDSDIDFHAEAFLKEYNPGLLTDPQSVDIEDFAGYYLGLETDYNYLSNCGLILGRMVFNDTSKLPVYVQEEKRADYIPAKRGTILIDNTLLEGGTEHRLRSTIGHECEHWVFHPGYFTQDCNQMSLFDSTEKTATACRKADIEGGRKELISDHDWLEHHAKYFGAAILMPKTAFVKAATEPEIRKSIRDYCEGFAEDECLADHLSTVFNVSPSSAKIRLKQLGVSMEVEFQQQRQLGQHILCYSHMVNTL